MSILGIHISGVCLVSPLDVGNKGRVKVCILLQSYRLQLVMLGAPHDLTSEASSMFEQAGMAAVLEHL